MNLITNDEVAKEILEKLNQLFIECWPSEHTYTDHVIHDRFYSLQGVNFMFFIDMKNPFFRLTFKAGTEASFASEITKIIDRLVVYDEYIIIADHFFDKAKNKIYFGIEAHDIKNEKYRKDRGQFKCPVCDIVFYNNQRHKSGICVHCHEIINEISWN